MIACWKGIVEEIHFGGLLIHLDIIENLNIEKHSFGPSKWPWELKTAKNSKLPKLPENSFEPVGKGGWPPISTWIKQQEDKHHSERSFEVGDWVFLRLQPYKQMSLKQAKKDNKLSPNYYGPYKVLQKIGTVAYKLELPASSQVHPVFLFHA